MLTLRFVCFFVFAIPVVSHTQMPSCKDLHNGIFYTYWPKTGDHFISALKEDTLTEIVVNINDTIVYRVKWTDDCTFSMKYLSGGYRLPKRIRNFNREHIFWNKIDKINDEYFVSRLYQDSPDGRMLKRDTSWFAQKTAVAVSTSFLKLSGTLTDKNTRFQTSPEYALLYVYRPSKVLLWLTAYPLYMDNEFMCTIQNNSGYVFRLNKEGLHTYTTRLPGDESSITLNVEFGQTYFLKPSIDWGVYKNLTNSKLRFTNITDPQLASKEFSEVKMR